MWVYFFLPLAFNLTPLYRISRRGISPRVGGGSWFWVCCGWRVGRRHRCAASGETFRR